MVDTSTVEAVAPLKNASTKEVQEMPMDDAKQAVAPTDVSLRLLVPASRTGSIIGKGGEYIQGLRQSTGAKIKIANTMPGCDERAVHITSPDSNEELVPAQDALLKLLDRIFTDEVDEEGEEVKVMVRLLVDSSQVGPLLGKGGSVINEMRSRSGGQIRVIQGATDLPIFRGPTDQLVQITGEFVKVRAALELVSQRLRENPPRMRPGTHPTCSYPRPLGSMGMLFPIPPGLMAVIQASAGVLLGFNGLVEAQYRIFVPDTKIGCIIGKGGDVIRQIREETKARVIVFNQVEGSESRVVMCRSMDEAPTLLCSAQEALCRSLYTLILEEDRAQGGQHTVRMLVPSDQVGAVLGKKGTVIKQIQMETGAKLVVQNEDMPACAQEGDELLEIRGRAQSVMQAVQACCALMRINMARSQAKAASAAMGVASSLPDHSGPVHPALAMRMHPGHMAVPMPPIGPMGMMGPHPRSMPMGMPHFGGPPMVASQPPHAGGLVLFNGTGGHGGHMAMRMAMNPVLGGPVIGTGGHNMGPMRQMWPEFWRPAQTV
eukprot:evm.model.scf_387.2 EVM.evm.TU.scf_387.2   scf_387:54486-59494(+)